MKLVSLLSSGIDSPVATHMMLEKGCQVTALHFWGEPYTDENALKRFTHIVARLEEVSGRRIKAGYIPLGVRRFRMASECDRKIQCVLCKRMMYQTAEKIAEKENASALLTGEAIGQVASQTLANILAIDKSVTIPVIRPLIGFDKQEIIERARAIGTYDISTQKGLCCGLVPKKPATAAKDEAIAAAEEKLDARAMVAEAAEEVTWLT